MSCLYENVRGQGHRRVSAEDDHSSNLLGDPSGLFDGQASNVDFRQFSRNPRFVDLRRLYGKTKTQAFEKLSTARRSRGQDETWERVGQFASWRRRSCPPALG